MKQLLVLFSALLVFSCSTNRSVVQTNSTKQEKEKALSPDSIKVIVHSANLSEDMSTLSSNDDELMLFIYNYDDSLITQPPLLSHYFVLNKTKMTDTIPATSLKSGIHHHLILFLVEMDSDKTIKNMEPLIRKYYKELCIAYADKNYISIQKYIGDDDILGVKKISDFNINDPVVLELNDIHRMDRFSYTITIN